MLVSCKWIRELAGFDPDPEELAERLTFGGLEVEGLSEIGRHDRIVIGRIVERKAHHERKKLHVVQVDSGAGVLQVICGAPNTPGPGARVVLALPGARVRDREIRSVELAGVRSEGMLCSEDELGIGPDESGILLLEGETDAAAGTPLSNALDLTDWIIDISVTPNRPDALSHRGVARETCLLYGRPFDPPRSEPAAEGGPSVEELARVDLRDPVGCPRYMAAAVTGLTARPSPFSLRYRLHSLGVRPISNLVDVTNLMLLEHGQPLHAFDLDRLAGSRIEVRRATAGERIRTLDEVERELTSEDLLICDGAGPVALAGVMGGEETGVTDATERLLLECAYFEPSGIRRTSKRLKLSSESSYRFERGVDPGGGPRVIEAAASLLARLGGGLRAPGTIDRYPDPIRPRRVGFRPKRYTELIGAPVGAAEARDVLEGIGAEVEAGFENLEVLVPTSRPDIEREIDLVEEIARVKGLDSIPSRLPRLRCEVPRRDEHEAIRRSVELLASLGLDESISYSLVSAESLEALGRSEKLVRISNPLSSLRDSMRTTLLAGLLENLKRAVSRFEPGIRQFEVGRTFHDEGGELPREVVRAAAVLFGPREAWIGESRTPLDFYDAKGLAVAFVEELSGATPELVPLGDESDAGWHPKRALAVRLEGERIGSLGEIHPAALSSLKLPRGAVGFELALMEIWCRRRMPEARPIPEQPPMSRDVALLVDEGQDAGPIRDALAERCGDLAERVELFDVYRGEELGAGRKSLAFSVVYRAPDRTLTDEEVDALHREAVAAVGERFAAAAR